MTFDRVNNNYLCATVLLLACNRGSADFVLRDTGALQLVHFNAADTFLGYSSGDIGAGLEQRWAAISFRINNPTATITRIDVNWFIPAGGDADTVNYIIWNRDGLAAAVNGDQFASGEH